jgi:hypothetical protein
MLWRPHFFFSVVLSTKQLLSAPGFFEEPCFPCRLRVDELLQESRPRRIGVADFLASFFFLNDVNDFFLKKEDARMKAE